MITHIVVYDSPRIGQRQRALCGELVSTLEQTARGGVPTCPECRRLDDQQAADLAALYDEAADLAQRQADYGV